jgi:hypothetical protein
MAIHVETLLKYEKITTIPSESVSVEGASESVSKMDGSEALDKDIADILSFCKSAEADVSYPFLT